MSISETGRDPQITPKQKTALIALLQAHRADHEWVNIGNRCYPHPTMRSLEKIGLVEINSENVYLGKLTPQGNIAALKAEGVYL